MSQHTERGVNVVPGLSVIDSQYHPLWESLSAYFQEITLTIKKEFPDSSSEMFCYKTQRRPFTGYDSFFARRDPSRTEDCTLMLEVVLRRDRLIAKFDISSGHGDLFAAGPEMGINSGEPEHVLADFLRAVERAAEEFFTENLDEVRRALSTAEP